VLEEVRPRHDAALRDTLARARSMPELSPLAEVVADPGAPADTDIR
jgi:hypothetical protein